MFIKLCSDSIARLEGSSSSLDNVLAEYLTMYINVKFLTTSERCQSFRKYMLQKISKRAAEFVHTVYYISMYLNPRNWEAVKSKRWTFAETRKEIASLVIKWNYKKQETKAIIYQLNDYSNNSAQILHSDTTAYMYWHSCQNCRDLRSFAQKKFPLFHTMLRWKDFSQDSHIQKQKYGIECLWKE